MEKEERKKIKNEREKSLTKKGTQKSVDVKKDNVKTKKIEEQFGSFTKFPDLILMDGGKGQVNIALQVLQELQLTIPVCGMVKDDNHRTRGLYFCNEEIMIDRQSEGFKLITRIQDEAHRFAIEYHRLLRSKRMRESVLDQIPSIGAVRKKQLLTKFRSVSAIERASIMDLETVLPKAAAEAVYVFFHNKQGDDS